MAIALEKPWQSKEVLEKSYDRMSTYDMADSWEISVGTVRYWMERHGIERNGWRNKHGISVSPNGTGYLEARDIRTDSRVTLHRLTAVAMGADATDVFTNQITVMMNNSIGWDIRPSNIRVVDSPNLDGILDANELDPSDFHPSVFGLVDPETTIDAMILARNYMDNLRKTSAIFTLGDITSDKSMQRRLEQRNIMNILGTWMVSDDYVTGKYNKFVNPNHVHRHRYGDIRVDCECGASIMYPQRTQYHMDSSGHRENCKEEWKEDAKDKLYRARADWVERGYGLWIKGDDLTTRMGLQNDNIKGSIGPYHAPISEWKREGMKRVATTWRLLRDEDVPTQKIADAYGTTRNNVYSYTGNEELVQV